MKNILVLAVVLFFIFVCSQAKTQAEQIVLLENGNLIVKEVKTVETVPGIPEGISAEIAYKLVMGETKEGVVRDEKGKKSFYFSYPLQKKTVFSDRLITYSQGKWTDKSVSRVEEKPDWVLTVLWFWIPAISFLLISMTNALSGIGKRKFLVFYAFMFAGVFVGAFVGVITGVLAGELIGGSGILTGVLAGILLTGVLAGELIGGLAGGLAGMLAGGLAGMLAGGLAGKGHYEIVAYYFVFLLAIEVASFIILGRWRCKKAHARDKGVGESRITIKGRGD